MIDFKCRLHVVAYPVKISLLVSCPLAPNPGDAGFTGNEREEVTIRGNEREGIEIKETK